MFTVADGLIWLRQSVQRNSMVRKIEIMKMRGQATLPGLHTFRIDAGRRSRCSRAGQCRCAAAAAGAARRRGAARLSMGVPALDEMLGGGLPRGYSLLVAGPSGSGKSILAAAFLAEGARRGETGVIAAFEQQPEPARATPTLATLIASGRVGAGRHAARPTCRSTRSCCCCSTEVRRLNATRVVIDSLSRLRAGAGADLPRRLPRVAAARWSPRWRAPASRC